jgi:hypothetical protein
MTITVELIQEEAMALLLNLEQLKVLKLVRKESFSHEKKVVKNPIPEKNSNPIIESKNVDKSFFLQIKPGFGGAKSFIHLSPDWDQPLEELNEYMF